MRPTDPEFKFHESVARYLGLALPAEYPWSTIGHGGGGRHRGELLKRLGLRPGVPDILIWVPPYGRTIGLELKKPKTDKASDAQRSFGGDLRRAGSVVYLCNTLAKVEYVLRQENISLRASCQEAVPADEPLPIIGYIKGASRGA